MEKELPDNLSLRLASQIKQLRLQRQWTRDELAARAGINIYTLKHFERYGQISLERLLKICECLEILEDLMRAFKPRARVSLTDWSATLDTGRRRGRRRTSETLPV